MVFVRRPLGAGHIWAAMIIVFCVLSPASAKLDFSLAGKTVVVTGGTKGIGKAVVEDAAEAGADIVITCSRNSVDIEACKQSWEERGLKIHACVADCATKEGRAVLVQFCQDLGLDEKGLSLLVNNIGTNVRKNAVEYSEEEVAKVFSTNLESAFWLSTAFYPMLLKSSSMGKGASVVNVGSVAGGCGTSIRSGAPYAMTKAAMVQLTTNLAAEWGKHNIRINSVSPAYIETPLSHQVLKNRPFLDSVEEKTPLRRVGRPEEVSAAILFLGMDVASYITGSNLAVDGGFLSSGFYPTI